jgi:methylenetetrahydrofolate dehydrogenase (NADP+)/methenyltetrahydrofolate cyclohydrolase
MSALILDGKAVSQAIQNELKVEVSRLQAEKSLTPGLAVILVGEDPASAVYVNNKAKACTELGMYSQTFKMDAATPEKTLLDKIRELNADTRIHGILVQHPIPNVKDETVAFDAIAWQKDVDCFNSRNVGSLVAGGDPLLPCTPAGVMELLKRYKIPTKGKHAVIVGRSNIVGKPMANLLMQKKDGANCTVTVCHSATPNISAYTRQADILIAAIGKANFIKAADVKPGAVVIDVGMNRIPDATKKSGARLTGDVDFEAVKEIASAITPVPGGVGLLTIAMLMTNTVRAAKMQAGL